MAFSSPEARPRYVVPRYRPADDVVWYHVLHGNVPGYQIDFMYCPEVPHRRFTQNHFGHLARLMKYLEPRERAPYAFALGNLSRDDVQHEPGHGGLALILGLRVHGVLDHAGRAMPPYAHAILAVDRGLDHATLLHAALALHQRLLPGGGEPHEDTSDRLYRRYARAVDEHPGTVEGLLRRHVDGFSALPRPEPSRLGWSYIAEESALPRRITITHADEEPFERLAQTMARLGAMLYRSNVKWTTISSGRELDIAGGVSVRLVPESEAISSDPTGMVISIDAIPEDEATMAHALFGARPKATVTVPVRVGWRERDAELKAADAAGSGGIGIGIGSGSVPAARRVCATIPLDPGFFAEQDALARGEQAEQDAFAQRVRRRLGLGLGAAAAGVCAIAAIVVAYPEAAPEATSGGAVGASSMPAQAISAPSVAAPDGAGPKVPAERLGINQLPSGKPRSVIRRPTDSTGAPRAPVRAGAPGAIGGTPRF